MAIKPFRDLLQKSVVNNVATRAWVVDLLRKTLGKLHFTGDVSQSADGHINFRAGGGVADECSFPFRVSTEPGTTPRKVRIEAGYVRSEVSSPIYPTIQGVPINRPTNPPWLTLPNNITTTHYVVLALTYTPATVSTSDDFVYFSGARIDSAQITLTTTAPFDQAPSIDWSTLTVSASGVKRVSLASFDGGAMTQSWWGNMHILLLAEGTVWLNMGA